MGKKVLVIGSGFGGLAAAVRLRAMGYDVTVLEANDQLGGRAAVFRRDGFSFDAGPTVITAPYLLEELFQLAGKNYRDYFELMPVDPFYRIQFHDGEHFDYVGDQERLIAEIARFNPADVDGYKKLCAHAERIFDIGYMQLADAPFDRLSDMLRVVPQMIKLGNYRTVYSLVSKYIKDDRLRQAFTFQPLLVGGNPFQTTSIYLLIHWLERKWGVHFPKGGTGAIIQGLAKLLTEMGVELRLNSSVEKIETMNGKVRGVYIAGGEFIAADLVVSNADPMTVYSKLLDPSDRSKHKDSNLIKRRPSMGLFVGYFGTKKQYPDLKHHTIVLGPRYKELLGDIFDRHKLADDFSLYLHAPTRSDSSLAPAGHEAFYVLSPVPNNFSGIDWETKGQEYFDSILDALEKRVLPGLRENLVTKFFVTPNYFEKNLQSYKGAGFGLEPRFSQSAYFRFHNKSEDIKGLYFVGASTHPGAGVPGVLCSAKVLEKVIPRPNG
jgi:phytoene desaturase